METAILDYVLEQLDAAKGRLPVIAKASGVPYRTLQKISLRVTGDPGISHVQKLYDYFRSQQAAELRPDIFGEPSKKGRAA